MKTISIEDVALHLQILVDEAAKGQAFVIASSGKPLVKVVPFEEPASDAEAPHAVPVRSIPRLGFARGLFSVPHDFDTMYQEEIEKMFYGGSLFPGEDEGLEDGGAERKARES